VIIIQVNALKRVQGVTKGTYSDPGFEKVSRSSLNLHSKSETENDVILLSLSNELKRSKRRLNQYNVKKIVKKLLTLPLNLLLNYPLKIIEHAKNVKDKISNTSKIQFQRLIIICTSSAKMLSLTIYLTLLRENIESNPGMKLGKEDSFAALTYNCNSLGDRKKTKKTCT
jgi:hypothetical protein